MIMMSLQSLRELAPTVTVGEAPHVAMTTRRVCFVADRPWDRSCTQEAAALVDWDGDKLILPPFSFDGDTVEPAPGHDVVTLVEQSA
jgi:hypothetical protein